ncbi:fructose bisphosphate aldolase [Luteococcus sanguinis]|uniref:fructose-bisphosphate aldolase n=1 Tax=Luteococcus sanguinis TaxID=174038 RepID=A0ABW1X083_9ACTN
MSTQTSRMASGQGFVAALDQSGGSTPKALKLYGIDESKYGSEAEMFELIHQMRERIITSPSFTSEKILAAILFEKTMDSQVEGKDTAAYLWENKQILPILKVDKGLQDASEGVRMMKPIPDLDDLLARAVDKGIFGTKMRSVIQNADPGGIHAIVEQQFDVANKILARGLAPIIEPEVDINAPDKEAAEDLLHEELLAHLDPLGDDKQVMLKLTIPTKDDLFVDLIAHPRILRVVALSGGYSRQEANERLARNHGLIASFSRALTEGLSADQSEEEFDQILANSIDEIYQASIT